MAKKKKVDAPSSCRLNKVGGEAVIEGVMMKAKDRVSTACRMPDGKIGVIERKFVSVRQKHRLLRLPIIRGFVNFIESMVLSFSVLESSAEVVVGEEEETKFEKWLKKHFGASLYDIVMFIAGVLGIALAIALFTFLPNQIALWIERLFSVDLGIWKAVLCGVLRIGIFIAYIALVSLMKDIRRTFEYHGAEHKTIACYEAGEELTPENAKKFTRFHPRCGTSFIFVMLLLSILVSLGIRFLCEVVLAWDFAAWSIGIFGRNLSALIYTLIGILTLPIIMGLGFEFLMLAGKHQGPIVRILSAPGLWMQRLTTREPDEEELETAIIALKCALCDEFPDFPREDYVIKDEYTNPPEKKKKGKKAENAAEDANGQPEGKVGEKDEHDS